MEGELETHLKSPQSELHCMLNDREQFTACVPVCLI